ncbi:MAG: acetate--CoA ligase [Vampirovibrionales bacterium]|nr:acetate--CoA ligase [Vampirovibrionales bacterium]
MHDTNHSNPWQDAENWLGLPRANGVNQATICLDNHPAEVMQREALRWLGQYGEREHYSFEELSRLSNQFANVLTQLGVQPSDRVFVFLERIPELYVSVFGALKVQAIVGPLFSAFGPEAILDRLADCEASIVITSPALKPRIDAIRDQLPSLKYVLVVNRHAQTRMEQASSALRFDNDLSFEQRMDVASTTFTVPDTAADTKSVIHYTSGTTGKPKGAVHCHGAVVAQSATARVVLDLDRNRDLYWCTADPGWVTGTSYGIFGPWSLGVTQLVYEGGFSAQDWYQILQNEGVTVWYTAPTAIRMLMKAGDKLAKMFNFSTLRHLASVGEPLNPEAIAWGERIFLGKQFHDTWWQTETGAMQIVNRPGLSIKPGAMGKPFPGVEAAILDDRHQPVPPKTEGHLVLKPSAPSFFLEYWRRPDVTASKFKAGWYFTGDRAWQDEEGYFWFVGRDDDVINTAGHLVGPFEVESALIEHPAVAEAAVIGKPNPERLEIVKAFVSLKTGYEASDSLCKDIQQFVRSRLAAHAYPREIDFLPSLPKTRSGKLMRRLLKARELGLPEGDTSTLED